MTADARACPAEPTAAALSYDEIAVGRTASFERVVTVDDVDRFADLSGDRNPLHLDDAYARANGLGSRIAHGMLVGALFSHLVGMHLPGRSALYMSQSIDFVAPVRPGDVLTIRGEIVAKTDALRAVTLRIEARASSGEVAARGRAIVRVLG